MTNKVTIERFDLLRRACAAVDHDAIALAFSKSLADAGMPWTASAWASPQEYAAQCLATRKSPSAAVRAVSAGIRAAVPLEQLSRFDAESRMSVEMILSERLHSIRAALLASYGRDSDLWEDTAMATAGLFGYISSIHGDERSAADGLDLPYNETPGVYQPIFSDARLSDLDGPLDVGWWSRDYDPWSDSVGSLWGQRFAATNPRRAAVALRAYYPHAITFSGTSVSELSDGSYAIKPTEAVHMGTNDRGLSWQGVRGRRLDARISRGVRDAIGIQFTRRYEWRVLLGTGGPRVGFVTTPVGAAEVFRLRDVPDGRRRREALCNWVRAHWRRGPSPDDGAAMIEVRRHLRGATRFRWSYYDCEIVPAAYDIETNEALRDLRKTGAKHIRRRQDDAADCARRRAVQP